MKTGAIPKKNPQGEREILLRPWGRDGGLLFILNIFTFQANNFISGKLFFSCRQPVSTTPDQSEQARRKKLVSLLFSIEILSQKPYYPTSNPETGNNSWLRSTLWQNNAFVKQALEKPHGEEQRIPMRYLPGRPTMIPGGRYSTAPRSLPELEGMGR
jgi:hypothetical protein